MNLPFGRVLIYLSSKARASTAAGAGARDGVVTKFSRSTRDEMLPFTKEHLP